MDKLYRQSIYTKSDIKWHYIAMYLDNLTGAVPVRDAEFNELLKKLRDYVDTKLQPEVGGDILDVFAIVEKEIN